MNILSTRVNYPGGWLSSVNAEANAYARRLTSVPPLTHFARPTSLSAENKQALVRHVITRSNASASTADISRSQEEEDMLALCAATNRGQSAIAAQRNRLASLIASLEHSYTPPDSSEAADDLIYGKWLLVYASENPTRSSPFFWAFKGLCEGIRQPLPGLPESLSDALFTITDGIPYAQVGQATHTITRASNANRMDLKSEVEVTLSVMDAFLPPSTGMITSTAELSRISPAKHEVTVLATAIKDSTWARLPFLSFVDAIEFPSRDVMEGMKGGSSVALMETTFLSNRLRISRVQGMTLVHVRDNSEA